MNELKPANLSFGIVIIPTEPIFSMISDASLKIAQKYNNDNIIDNKMFPAHISIILTGTNKEYSNSIFQKLKAITSEFKDISLTANEVYLGRRGYIGVKCGESQELKYLCYKIIAECANFHQKNQVFRPHIIERWNTLRETEKESVIKYGAYKIFDNSDFHLSVAIVDNIYQKECFELARTIIKVPQTFKINKFQFVDMGHKNEKWDVLYEW